MTLAERAASANAEETAGLLEELRIAANQITPPYWHTMRGINTPESLLAAAMMLVPEGLVWKVMTDFELPGRATVYGSVLTGQIKDRGWTADAATPALALIAAIALSKGL